MNVICQKSYLTIDEVEAQFGIDGYNRARRLLDDGLLQHAFDRSAGTEGFTISLKGKDFLETYRHLLEEKAEQRAKTEQQQTLQEQLADKRWRKDARRSWIQWTITTLLAIVSFVLGAMLEYRSDVIERFLSLFQ